jgi:hypothetical protein
MLFIDTSVKSIKTVNTGLLTPPKEEYGFDRFCTDQLKGGFDEIPVDGFDRRVGV